MKTIQRIYLYLVSGISLTAVTWAVILLARLILSEGIGQGQITELAGLLAVIIVGLPIFLFHWLIAQKMATNNPADRAAIIRRFYLWFMMGVGAVPIIANAYLGISKIFLLLLGGSKGDFYPHNLTAVDHLAAIIAWGVVWFYLWRQIQTDDRIIPPTDDHLTLRRIYLFIFAQTGLILTSLGAIELLRILMETTAVGLSWRTPVSDSSAQLLVGGAVWIAHWLILQKLFLSGTPAEERSVLRKIYLYLNIFIYLVMTIFSASALLKRLIELALGGSPSEEPLLSQLSVPIPLLIVGGILWVYHWMTLNQDARQAPEGPRQATVRRIYAYLVAAIGLGVLLGGIIGLLTILIDMLTTPAVIGLDYYREQISVSIAMIIVGVPVWLLPWRRSQNLALTPADTSATGQSAAEERRSTTRKIYLYFYLLAGMLAIFGSAGWFVYHILTALLGATLPDDFITLVLNALIITLLAAGVSAYHWLAIRKDGELEKTDEAQKLSTITVTVIDDDAGQVGQTIIEKLEQALPGIGLQKFGLTEEATAALDGQSFTPNTVLESDYIIGSWQALTAPAVAPAVANSQALKLVIPLVEPGWIWTGLQSRSVDAYAAQAVRGIKQAIEGEDVNLENNLHPGLVVLAVIGGLFGFFVLAGIGIELMTSIF